MNAASCPRARRQCTSGSSISCLLISWSSNIKYTRLKKKFGTVTKDANTPSDDVTPAADVGIETPKKKGPAKNGSAKKRKVSEVDDEERAPVKKEQGDEDVGLLCLVSFVPANGFSRNSERVPYPRTPVGSRSRIWGQRSRLVSLLGYDDIASGGGGLWLRVSSI